MPDQNDNVSHTDAPFQPLVDYWTSCVRQANETTKKMLGGFNGNADPNAWRRQWFDTLGQQTDVYLRAPLFLQMMKSHIETLVQAKQEANVSQTDLNSLAKRLGNIEETMRLQLEQLERRIETLESKAVDPSTADGWERFLDALRVSQPTPQATMGITPHEIVYEEGTLKLLRYQNDSARFAAPILICYALVNRPYILDLQDDRSVLQQLLHRGFEVYLIDWGVPTDADHALRLHDYVCRLLRKVTDFVCEQTTSPQVNLLGYCMGGTMSTMYTALFPERVRNLVLMATPIDFGGDAGLLNLWAREEYFDVDKLIDAYGNCPGEFLQYCFQLMKPVQNFAEKYVTFCEKLDDNAFLDNFFAMERWASDSIPVAGETFREYVKMLYQQNRLVKGEMSLDGVPVRLDAITCPLLMLVAEQDHLVPPSSTLALQQHVCSSEVKSMSINAGHIGLAVSSKAHRQLWPQVADWIADHSTERL